MGITDWKNPGMFFHGWTRQLAFNILCSVCSRPKSENKKMEQPPPIPATPPPTTMPLWARLMNVFAVPGDVFEQVRIARVATGNWLLPLLLAGLTTAGSFVIVASQPALQQQIKEAQEKSIEQKVSAGKKSREDADRELAWNEKLLSPTVLKSFAGFGGIVVGAAKVFGWALVLWLLSRSFLKVRLGFMKAAEIAGLAAMIAVLGTLVTLLLQVNFSNPSSSPSLALAVNFDPKNPMHLILAALNLFDLWHLFVMAVGLSRLTSVPFMRTSFTVVGFWLIWMTAMIALSSITRGFAG